MAAVLYDWPGQAFFGQAVPKSKFYEHGSVSTALKKRFVDEVEEVRWAYKLSPETLRMQSGDQVPEIQVFAVRARTEELSEAVLAAIDKAVPYPIVFEVSDAPQPTSYKTVMAYKQTGRTTMTLSPYFHGDWVSEDAPRSPLPSALDLAQLYQELLSPLTPLQPRRSESMSELAERIEAVKKLERRITRVRAQMGREKQLNKQMEVRRELLELEAEHQSLTAPDPAPAERQ